ncbi:uncharacterized protein LOC121910102 [Thunnus maccoyii]|uniref:uncharacterized protein LOC121910102 n=1 Tax=Thunnus maccoyii TaxID=8240 RepID=UPI001C4B2227|nr:uncharacterized protein LOC121910102 [Thunnus maccoyii]
MSINISESEWKRALTSILEQLDKSEYKKMLLYSCFDKIPKRMKTEEFKEEMPQLIIQHFGVDESISAINEAMIYLPRNDSAVQDLLRPFVDKLRKKHEEENRNSMKETKEKTTKNQRLTMTTLAETKGKKRKHDSDSKLVDKEPKPKTGFKRNNIVSDSDSSDEEQKVATGFKRNSIVSDSDSSDEEQKVAAGFKRNNAVSDSDSSDDEQEFATDQLKSDLRDRERKIPPWRKTIKDVLTSGDLGNKVITGKVVQKSALRTYETQQRKKRFFFYLGVSDETSCIKVMVYGADLYQDIQEGSCYSIRNVIMDENVMKVTKQSKVAETGPVDVPEELEMEAGMLIYHQKPVCSIAKAREYADKTVVSVQGTVTEIGHVEPTKMKKQRRKKEKQHFQLNDGKDSIRITLWGRDTAQLRGTSDGDFVRVTNVKTSHYYETFSLNSTDFTRIYKIKSAAMQNATIEIIGIIKANNMETQLEASVNNQVETLVVASKLLAKVFGVRLEGDLKNRLVQKIPLSAHVDIQGSTIKTITEAKEM